MSEENLNEELGKAADEGGTPDQNGQGGATSESAAAQDEVAEAARAAAASSDSAGSGDSPESSDSAQSASSADELVDPLSEAMNTITSLEDQLARARAELYNLQQEYNGYVRRSKQEGQSRREEGIASVIENLLPVLDDVELARQHGDLQGPTGQIAEKIEQILRTNYKVERFGAEGDEFDPMIHEALMHQTSPDATAESVSALIQPGYRQGDKLLRAARVGVVSPE